MPQKQYEPSNNYDSEEKETDPNLKLEMISTMLNQMLGSSLLLIPDVFYSDGIISCSMVVAFLGYLNYSTANIGHHYIRPSDADLSSAVKRNLSPFHSRAYSLNTALFFFSLSLVIFMFSTDMISSVITYFLSFYEPLDVLFSPYKFTSTAFFMAFSFYFLLKSKDISIFMSLGVVGLISMLVLLIFILFHGIYNVLFTDFSFSSIKWFSWNISNILSIIPLALANQPSIVPLVRKYKKNEEISNDIMRSYLYGSLFYIAFGIIGVIAVSPTKDPSIINSIVSYYSNSFFCILTNVCFLFSLLTTVPLFVHLSQKSFFTGIGVKTVRSWQRQTFKIFFISFSLLAKLSGFNVESAMGIAGCVFAFYVTLYVPLLIKLTHHERTVVYSKEKLLDEEEPKRENLFWVKGQFYFILSIGILLILLQFYKLFSSI